jgi:hypothetical protein
MTFKALDLSYTERFSSNGETVDNFVWYERKF